MTGQYDGAEDGLGMAMGMEWRATKRVRRRGEFGAVRENSSRTWVNLSGGRMDSSRRWEVSLRASRKFRRAARGKSRWATNRIRREN